MPGPDKDGFGAGSTYDEWGGGSLSPVPAVPERKLPQLGNRR